MMNRAMLTGVALLSVFAAGSSMAASNKVGDNHTGPMKNAVMMQESEACHTLARQYDDAVRGHKEDAALVAARKTSTNARNFCANGDYDRGADQYRAALKGLGVQPKG